MNMVNKISYKKQCKIRDFAQVLGSLVAACPAVEYGWIYLKRAEHLRTLALDQNQGDFEKTEFNSRIKIRLGLVETKSTNSS